MNVEPYMRIIHNRFVRGKMSPKKYVRMVQQLMLWSMAVVQFEPYSLDDLWEDDWDFDEDEREE